jgi:hypothetical protein
MALRLRDEGASGLPATRSGSSEAPISGWRGPATRRSSCSSRFRCRQSRERPARGPDDGGDRRHLAALPFLGAARLRRLRRSRLRRWLTVWLTHPCVAADQRCADMARSESRAGACVPRAPLVMVAPDPRHPRRSQADLPLIDLSEFGRPPLRGGHTSQKSLKCEVVAAACGNVAVSVPR